MTNHVDRRALLRGGLFALAAPTVASLLAACGANESSPGPGSGSGGSSTRVLKFPLVQAPQPPDPDTYMGEAMTLIQMCYEGLIQYKPGTKDFAPQLAEKWEISKDQLTYTFHLKPNVKFHDGTPADAASWVQSFQRRLDRNQGPAYMIKAIEKATAPDATTLVIRLKELNRAFMHYLACPWHPFAVSPTAVAKNAKGGDLAVAWLTTHDAGTGPYTLTQAQVGTDYILEAFDGWWGPQPEIARIECPVIPDPSTRRLELESGDFTIVPKGFAYDDLMSLKKNSKLQVDLTHTAGLLAIYFDLTNGVMKDKTLREAVMKAIDRKAMLDAGYEGYIQPTTSFFSKDVVNAADFPLELQYDPSALQQWVKTNGSQTISIGYSASGGASYTQMAETLQTQLSAAGLKVTTRQVQSSESYAYATNTASRPDLFIATNWSSGDALHIDTGLRIEVKTGANLLNWFAYSNPEVDKLLDKALVQKTDAAATKVYQQIAQILQSDYYVLPLGNDMNGLVAQADVHNIVVDSYLTYIFRPEKLTFS